MKKKKEKKKHSFWRDFGFGFKCYKKAFKLCFTTRMSLAFIIPFILLLVMIFGGWELKSWVNNYISNWVMDVTSINNLGDSWWVSALATFIEVVVYIAFTLLFFLIFAYFGGYIVLIVMSPVLALLSEKTEELETGNTYPFDIVQLGRDVFRGILIALRNLFIELGLMIIIFITGYIPVIGWIASAFGWIFLFFVASYFYGFSFMDYSLERRRLTIKQSATLMKKRKGIAIANGMIFSFVLMIPLIGVILSTFFAIISVVAGVIAMNEVLDQEEEYRDIPKQLMEEKKKQLNAEN